MTRGTGTDRRPLLPPEGATDGSFHWLRSLRNGEPVPAVWHKSGRNSRWSPVGGFGGEPEAASYNFVYDRPCDPPTAQPKRLERLVPPDGSADGSFHWLYSASGKTIQAYWSVKTESWLTVHHWEGLDPWELDGWSYIEPLAPPGPERWHRGRCSRLRDTLPHAGDASQASSLRRRTGAAEPERRPIRAARAPRTIGPLPHTISEPRARGRHVDGPRTMATIRAESSHMSCRGLTSAVWREGNGRFPGGRGAASEAS